MNNVPQMRDKKFFSYATVAPMCQESYEAVKIFTDEFYCVGPPEVLYHYDPYVEHMAQEAARLINCSPEEITYIKNTTEGINIAADVLPLSEGDEVLVMGNEYPANLLPWLNARKRAWKVTVIKGTDNPEAYARLLQSVTPQTKAIAVSSAQYYDGYVLDLSELSEFCRQRGIFLVLDAVQSIGVHKVDVSATPVDFLVAGGQKYLQAGMGIGFMYVNRNTLSKLREGQVGIRSMLGFDEDSYRLRDTAARFQDGTQNMAGIVSLHAALQRINAIGIEAIEAKNRQLLVEFKAVLHEHDIDFIDHGDRQANIIAMKVDDAAELFTHLKDRSVYIKPIKGNARLSFIHESSVDDVRVMAGLIRQWKAER